MKLFHDSRDTNYRMPSGARCTGETIRLRLRVEDGTARKVCLRVWWNSAEQRFEMTDPKGNGHFEYALKLPDSAGLLWYYFIVVQDDGWIFYGNAHDQMGGEGAVYDHEPPSYQITVYDADYQPPKWMGDGIMYQIMTDRFFAKERIQPPKGWLHDDWHEPPALKIHPGSGDNMADDFFGGNLAGIEEKLPYLKRLGVSVIYLNPIFCSPSNHKYNTADYSRIDPSFGTQEEFTHLCETAKSMGIRIVLDGVLSHTGSDSIYFNKSGEYGSGGAYRSRTSPYYSWYDFEHWPDKYDCWWGFDTLPNVKELEPDYIDYMLTGEKAILPMWLGKGASGWRLDVADELPMEFLRILRRAVKKQAPDACVLGEVWEDASHKEAYNEVRTYCLGDTLDSVMNYPLREGVIDFLTGRLDAYALKRRLESLYENYPEPFARSLMNLLGSHDKARIINRLSGATPEQRARSERRFTPLTKEQYELGRERYIRAWTFICAMPGMPCIYYGDEAGAQGDDDPFCRGTYPWGREDRALISTIERINRYRLSSETLRRGSMELLAPDENTLIVRRRLEGHAPYGYALKR